MEQGDYFLNVGEFRLMIARKALTINVGTDLAYRIAAVRAKHSPFSKVEKLENETSEAWYARYLQSLGQDSTRLDGESQEKFLERTFKPVAFEEEMSKLRDYLTEVADLFGQKDRVTDDGWGKVCIEELTVFLTNVFKKCRISTADLE